jgi:hypothetical protein
MTSESNTPEWVRKHNEQKAEEARLEAAATDQRRAAAVSVRAGAPDFWTRFVAGVEVNARALRDLEGAELVGNVSVSAPSSTSPEHQCHISVNRVSTRLGPLLSNMNLWYAPGGSHIRCWYQNQPLPDFGLGIRENEVLATVGGDQFTAEQLAEHVVQWMVKQLNRRGV